MQGGGETLSTGRSFLKLDEVLSAAPEEMTERRGSQTGRLRLPRAQGGVGRKWEGGLIIIDTGGENQ